METDTAGPDILRQLLGRLERIETKLDRVVEERPLQQWFSVDEAAAELGKTPYTVREWCRRGRLKARKWANKSSRNASWSISREELDRYRREGLLPDLATAR